MKYTITNLEGSYSHKSICMFIYYNLTQIDCCCVPKIYQDMNHHQHFMKSALDSYGIGL